MRPSLANAMRRWVQRQGRRVYGLQAEEREPLAHRPVAINGNAGAPSRAIGADPLALRGRGGCPLSPTEPLLKAQLRISLFGIRTGGARCGQPDYNVLYHWFLDITSEQFPLDSMDCAPR